MHARTELESMGASACRHGRGGRDPSGSGVRRCCSGAAKQAAAPGGCRGAGRTEGGTSPTKCGSPLVDEPGEHDCLVRASYAVGRGPKRADIEGFALRMFPAGARRRVTDILFASTGVGPVGRYLLAVRRPGEHGPQTTLLPVRAAGRPLQLRLEPVDPRSQPWPTLYQLSWAYGRGRWHPFGALTVAWGGPGDAAERFDPVAHPLPETTQYPAVAWLREPSYQLARLARPS